MASRERREARLAAKSKAGDGGMGRWRVQPGGLWGGIQAALHRLRMGEAGTGAGKGWDGGDGDHQQKQGGRHRGRSIGLGWASIIPEGL